MKTTGAFLLFFIIFFLSFGPNIEAKEEVKMISAKEAQAIAEKLPETQALLTYRDGALASCIERKVSLTCDTDYVTCRDDAWVVQYLLTPKCPVKTDGRLAMYYLVDGPTGKVLSRYPEIEYFKNEKFCRDDADCLGGTLNDGTRCINFIAAPFIKFDPEVPGECGCKNSQCVPKSEK